LQRTFPNLPLIGTGYSWLQRFLVNAAEANIRNGKITIASTGRGAIAYPDYVKDLMQYGELKRSKVCIAVSYCTNLMRAKHNEMGQFESGCVPRDPVYAKIYKESLQTAEKENISE
jgi:NADPH2 dehydrogenase